MPHRRFRHLSGEVKAVLTRYFRNLTFVRVKRDRIVIKSPSYPIARYHYRIFSQECEDSGWILSSNSQRTTQVSHPIIIEKRIVQFGATIETLGFDKLWIAVSRWTY